VWEWRAFGSGFRAVEALVAEERVEQRYDTYLLSPELGVERALKLRGGRTLELKVQETSDGALELWGKPFMVDLEVPPWRTRELARALAPGAPVPVRALRGQDDVVRLLRDVRLGDARVVVVGKRIRFAVIDPGVRVEHAALDVPRGTSYFETVAVEGADPAEVREVVTRLGLDRHGEVASYPAWLTTQ
jgi:hypothetical protein